MFYFCIVHLATIQKVRQNFRILTSCDKRRLRQPFDTTSRAYAQVVTCKRRATPKHSDTS